MYVVYRQVPGGGKLYFQTNEDDSPKWTTDKERAKQFATKKDALKNSDHTGIYEMIAEEI